MLKQNNYGLKGEFLATNKQKRVSILSNSEQNSVPAISATTVEKFWMIEERLLNPKNIPNYS